MPNKYFTITDSDGTKRTLCINDISEITFSPGRLAQQPTKQDTMPTENLTVKVDVSKPDPKLELPMGIKLEPKPPAPQIMLDLETLGTAPGSVIKAIGAVLFSAEKGVISTFYRRIDLQSCITAGLVMDPETVAWWLKQSDDARAEMTKPGEQLAAVLDGFRVWLESDGCEVWGNGSDFDNAMLSAAYRAAKLPQPWKFFSNRCYRTLKNAHPEIQMQRKGTHHNALDDATDQALHLLDIWKEQRRQRAAVALVRQAVTTANGYKLDPGLPPAPALIDLHNWLTDARRITDEKLD